MDILSEKSEVSIEDIMEALEYQKPRRWVLRKARLVCIQYPFLFEQVNNGKKVIGFKKKLKEAHKK